MAVGTTNYPASLDTVVELVEAANNAADTLSAGISAGDTSLTLVDATEFAASGIVAIEDELISYTGKAGSTLTGLTRGIESTTAASHSSGADVRQVITAASHNVQSAAIIALETKLGTGTDIAWSQMSPLTANRLVVTDGAGDVAVSPLTHDATNAVIGNIGGLDFDTTPTATPTAARMVWDDTHGTVNLTLKGGTVGVDIGQTTVARVVNKTVTNINLLRSSYQVVRIVSAQGQRLAISLAQGNSEPNSTDVIGLVAEDIANNQEGFIVARGLITEINTTGSLQGETWADGDILYLSPTTAGGLTKVEPQAPDHLIIVGYVVYAHSQHGKIYVAIQTSWETKELHDVKITGTPAAGSLLIRNATTGVWENATLTAGSNITITNADKSITIAATGSGDVVGPSSATDNALARFDTTTGKLIQNSVITLSDAGALSFPDGVRQTFNPNGTNAGINVGAHTSDPSSPTNGDLWYNSTANQLKTRRGATTEVVATIPSNLGDEIPVLNATTGNLSATGEVFWDGSGNALQIGNVSTGALRLVNATGTDSFTLLPPASGGTVALTLPPGIGSSGQALTSNGTGGTSWTTITAGVSSVSGTSPVVSSGGSTPAISLASGYGDTQNPYASKTANNFLAAPNGTAGAPTFRAIVAADIPTLNQNTTGTASNVTGTVAIANGGTGATTAGAALTNLGAYPASNPSGYTSNTGTVTSVGGTGTVNGITLTGSVSTTGNLTLGGTLSGVSLTTQVTGTLPIANGGTGQTTQQAALNALAGAATSGQYLRGNGTNVVMSAIQAGDVPTLNQNTTGTAANVTGVVAIANGGTGQTTRQDAMDALAGAVTAGQYLRGNGTDVVMSAIQAADVPTLNQNTTGTASNVTGTVAIANGGTGATTAGAARTNLGATTVGGNLFTLTNPSAVTFPRFNADNTVSALNAADFRTAIGAGTGNGTVTSVTGTSPVASSGGATPAISLNAAYGDTLNPYGTKTANNVLAGPTTGAAAAPTFRALVDNDIPDTLTLSKISNLTSNGFVKTSAGDGTLAVDTNTYLTGNQTITLSGDVTGSGATSITTAIAAGVIVDADINASAAISISKLAANAITIAGTSTSLGGSISRDTITGLSTTGVVKRTGANTLTAASIVNADIDAAAAIGVSKLAASTISGITLGNNLNALTIGTGLSGTSYNGSSAVTIGIDSTVATLSGSQTLSNKTLSSAILTGTLTAGGGVGTSGQFLQSTATGVQWATVSAAPGGSNTQVQFNDGGVFGGDAGLVFDKTNRNLTVGATGTANQLRLVETGGGTDYVALRAPSALAANYTLTLPVDDGSANQVLTTDGSGVLSWATPSSGGRTTLTANRTYYVGFDLGTCTISNASPGVVTLTGHGLSANDPVIFSTTGTLPAPLIAGAVYYVKTVLTADTFTVSLTSGGTVINTTSAGSGTHRARTGKDTNDGLTSSRTGAFLTVQKAINTIAALDLSSFAVTVQLARGRYLDTVRLASYTGAGPVTILGNASSVADTVLQPYSLGSVTCNATTDVIEKTAHGLVAGTPIQLFSYGSVPTGLSMETTYYVGGTVNANDFQIFDAPSGGNRVTWTTNGSFVVLGGYCVRAVSVLGKYVVKGVTIASSNGLYGARINQSTVEFNTIDLSGSTAADAHLWAEVQAAVTLVGTNTVSAGAGYAYICTEASFISSRTSTMTMVGTPAFSKNFCFAARLGCLLFDQTTFSGSATGSSYLVASNSVLQATLANLPGNSAGTTATGGQAVNV